MRTRTWFGLVVAALMLFTTACSSSGSTSNGTGSTVSSSSSSTGGSTVGGTGAGSPGLRAAQRIVSAAETFPTSFGNAIPELPSKPPTGKTVVFLQCEQESCPFQGKGISAAAALVGWKVKTLNWQQADPSSIVTALKTALQYHPVAVMFAGAPEETWSSMKSAYQAAGAVIMPSSLPTTPTGPGVLPGHAFEADETDLGQLLAAQTAVSDGGAGGKALLVTVPSYPVYGPVVSTFTKDLKQYCPNCSSSELDVTLQQLQAGGLDQAVVSQVKRDPAIKYIVSVAGTFTAQLPAALQAAGLSGKYTLIAGKGGAADQQNVLDGKQLSSVDGPFVEGGWQDMDEAIRHVMGLPIPAEDHRARAYLLTKDNIETPSDSYDLPANYEALFKQIWRV